MATSTKPSQLPPATPRSRKKAAPPAANDAPLVAPTTQAPSAAKAPKPPPRRKSLVKSASAASVRANKPAAAPQVAAPAAPAPRKPRAAPQRRTPKAAAPSTVQPTPARKTARAAASSKAPATLPAKPPTVTVKKAVRAPSLPKQFVTSSASKASKPKKPKLVRDSFTIPKPEFMVLDVLKLRAATLGKAVKKSELLRAGIKALLAMSNADFVLALEQVPAVKTGRPAHGE